MIRLIFSYKFFFLLGFISNLAFADLPDEHEFLIEINEQNQSSFLNHALQNSILKILGSYETYIKKENFFNSINPRDFISEFGSFNESDKSFSKIIIDASSLRNFLVKNGFDISSEIKTKFIGWILCDADLDSLKFYKRAKQKCEQIKKNLFNISQNRNADLYFPILDSEDLISFKAQNKEDEADFIYLSDRYKADSFIYCRLSYQNENCYLPDKNLSGRYLNFSKNLKPNLAMHTLIDSVLSDQILEINSLNPKPFTINIKNISSLDDYKNVLKEVKKIIIFSDVTTYSLSGNELSLSTSLIGNYDQISKLFLDYSFFILEDANEASISLIYN
ncbi:MAG: DUF2066 domain-containing protein [Gammaproteobacteria bacterium]|nr:MAG: DUF2066 domain-containing protein [Gammaproteobacteria bacterium]